VAGPDAAPPLIADPFSGGGSLPLEGLRLGCNAYASDLNPVAALLSKVTLEYVQRLGEPLLRSVADWSSRIQEQARRELAPFYPADPDGASPIAYLFCRTIQCEGPGCNAEVPLVSKFHLSREKTHVIGLRVDPSHPSDAIRFTIEACAQESFPLPTVRRGAATCLRCGFSTKVEQVRHQLSQKQGGGAQARLLAVVTVGPAGRRFRLPTDADLSVISSARDELARRLAAHQGDLSLLPEEPLPPIGTLGFRVQRYGMHRWRDLFTPRQLLTLTTLVRLVRSALSEDTAPGGLGVATRACLALMVNRLADYLNTGCSWNPSGAALPHLFTRQAVPIIWDFGEANPFGGSAGDLQTIAEHVLHGLRNALVSTDSADVTQAFAQNHPLPTDCANLLCTDPPYYDAIPYADLSDFFFVWLKRMLGSDHPALFGSDLSPRDGECIVSKATGKDRLYFRQVMTASLAEARRITRPDGVAVLIFAHKSTAGWEDQLGALIDAGWIITASWPIDTENTQRLRARNSAVLASSIHLVCRPRERPDGTLITDTVGQWRDILEELPRRIHTWLPRLAREGVVGADALFACLGPALELFSRYARVEKASGEVVPLKDYLEQVWAAIAREAMNMIFTAADASQFEEDARLTAMWLWTANTDRRASSAPTDEPDESSENADDEEDAEDGASRRPGGLFLEYDAARKMAMGLGVRLESLASLVEVKGGWARLLPLSERAPALLGAAGPPQKRRRVQMELSFDPGDGVDPAGAGVPVRGATVLSRVHQAMLLFSGGRGTALRHFLAEPGTADDRFWRLAQALTALYPRSMEEKRWIEGLLSSKKRLGL
jgi:adenine-specific DNA methylase